MLGLQEIQKILPHRYPFLLIDKIVELEKGRRAVGIKNVSGNEPYFQGHFPDYPIMPGVLLVETMAQVGAAALLKAPEHEGKIAYFTGIDKARFRRQVVPGDQLEIEVDIIKIRGALGRGKGRILVEKELAAESELMFAIGQ